MIMSLCQANVVMATMAMTVNARIVSEYIPGSGCGTVNTIKMLDRDPSVQELAIGCIYVRKEVSAFKPKQGINITYCIEYRVACQDGDYILLTLI